jgi:acylphosphatase
VKARADVTISGRVQGVFFRASAREEALRLRLTGEVRNLSDGSVNAVAEGEREDVEAFVAWCGRGPPAARVERAEVAWSEATGEFAGFRITR